MSLRRERHANLITKERDSRAASDERERRVEFTITATQERERKLERELLAANLPTTVESDEITTLGQNLTSIIPIVFSDQSFTPVENKTIQRRPKVRTLDDNFLEFNDRKMDIMTMSPSQITKLYSYLEGRQRKSAHERYKIAHMLWKREFSRVFISIEEISKCLILLNLRDGDFKNLFSFVSNYESFVLKSILAAYLLENTKDVVKSMFLSFDLVEIQNNIMKSSREVLGQDSSQYTIDTNLIKIYIDESSIMFDGVSACDKQMDITILSRFLSLVPKYFTRPLEDIIDPMTQKMFRFYKTIIPPQVGQCSDRIISGEMYEYLMKDDVIRKRIELYADGPHKTLLSVNLSTPLRRGPSTPVENALLLEDENDDIDENDAQQIINDESEFAVNPVSLAPINNTYTLLASNPNPTSILSPNNMSSPDDTNQPATGDFPRVGVEEQFGIQQNNERMDVSGDSNRDVENRENIDIDRYRNFLSVYGGDTSLVDSIPDVFDGLVELPFEGGDFSDAEAFISDILTTLNYNQIPTGGLVQTFRNTFRRPTDFLTSLSCLNRQLLTTQNDTLPDLNQSTLNIFLKNALREKKQHDESRCIINHTKNTSSPFYTDDDRVCGASLFFCKYHLASLAGLSLEFFKSSPFNSLLSCQEKLTDSISAIAWEGYFSGVAFDKGPITAVPFGKEMIKRCNMYKTKMALEERYDERADTIMLEVSIEVITKLLHLSDIVDQANVILGELQTSNYFKSADFYLKHKIVMILNRFVFTQREKFNNVSWYTYMLRHYALPDTMGGTISLSNNIEDVNNEIIVTKPISHSERIILKGKRQLTLIDTTDINTNDNYEILLKLNNIPNFNSPKQCIQRQQNRIQRRNQTNSIAFY